MARVVTVAVAEPAVAAGWAAAALVGEVRAAEERAAAAAAGSRAVEGEAVAYPEAARWVRRRGRGRRDCRRRR